MAAAVGAVVTWEDASVVEVAAMARQAVEAATDRREAEAGEVAEGVLEDAAAVGVSEDAADKHNSFIVHFN